MDTKEKHERYEAFLADLGAISSKHGVVISGCGCCGSPFLNHGNADGTPIRSGHYGHDSYDDITWVEDVPDY